MPYCCQNLQVQELTSPPRASQVVKECAQACMQTTYQFLYDNANDLYARQFQVLILVFLSFWFLMTPSTDDQSALSDTRFNLLDAP